MKNKKVKGALTSAPFTTNSVNRKDILRGYNNTID